MLRGGINEGKENKGQTQETQQGTNSTCGTPSGTQKEANWK